MTSTCGRAAVTTSFIATPVACPRARRQWGDAGGSGGPFHRWSGGGVDEGLAEARVARRRDRHDRRRPVRLRDGQGERGDLVGRRRLRQGRSDRLPSRADLRGVDAPRQKRRRGRTRRRRPTSRCRRSPCRRATFPARSSGPAGAAPTRKAISPSRRCARSTRPSSRAEVASHLSGRVGSNRDVLVYVHGFNTSYDEARFRLAQVVTDGRFGGVPVLFTWPASGSLFDYEAAKESASASRDQLAQLLLDLGATPDVGRIHILAHSMGTWLTMEALRQDAIAGKPDLDGKLGDVMLAAPRHRRERVPQPDRQARPPPHLGAGLRQRQGADPVATARRRSPAGRCAQSQGSDRQGRARSARRRRLRPRRRRDHLHRPRDLRHRAPTSCSASAPPSEHAARRTPT